METKRNEEEGMASTALPSFTILSLLLLAASSCISAGTHEAFLQCFLKKTNSSSSASSSLIHTPDTPSFYSIHNATVRNSRFASTSGATKPTFVVTPKTGSDVQAAVTCGKATGLHLRVRSGGHDYEARSSYSNGDPFVIVDLANLRSITVDAAEGTAWVGAGATVGELYYNINAQTKKDTVAFPASLCASVGVGGIIGGGGLSAMSRKFGAAADNVVDASIVDVNGRILDRELMGEDLFWAIRGGSSASFGVVLAYKIRLVSVPPTVTVFRVNRTLEQDLSNLVEKWQKVSHDSSDDLFLRILTIAVGAGANRTILATFEGMLLGGRDEFLSALQNSYPELGVEANDLIELKWIESTLFFAGYPTTDTSLLLDRRPYRNRTFKAKSDFPREPISADAWDKIWKYLLDAVDESLQIIISPWGGKFEEIPEDAIPFPHRKGNFINLQYFLFWPDSPDEVNQKHLDFMRGFYDFMAPYVSSNPRATYFNVKDLDLGTNKIGNTTYSDATVWGKNYFRGNFERLARVKALVDPDNYFWNEQSIPPFSA
ncbi:berberine bridge enzyme-like 26 [Phoenix dactylifera]|uniref:Berberine bridge enzyme-like 26 n=1 Tax=Phoenix dactylifera TaxID=42345 RepID=A0A8B7C3U8_PHODC|nr:berberine bridge enzyme-like 26 [Phoenix dactylifera]